MPMTHITLFGALEVAYGDAPPRRPPTQRVLSLLGFLITRHHVPQGRDKLVDLLWPDLMPRQGRRMLSDTLWRARRLLAPDDTGETPLLIVAADTVTFRPDPATWVDVIAFEQQMRPLLNGEAPAELDEAALDQVRAAVELYRGDFLEDCYDDWALYERERLRELYLSSLQVLLSHYQRARAYDLGLRIALRLVRADPLREEAHRELMRLYYLLGREADALRAFEHCRTVLEEELGVEPAPDTLSLYDEIAALQRRRVWEQARIAGQPAAAPPPAISRELPFVGYHEQRAAVMEAVEQAIAGAGGMVLVAGEAGLGKSRLLNEIAAGAAWRGAQVIWGRGREDAQALPFGPLREALAEALTPLRAMQLVELLPAHTLGVLAPLLPQMSDLLPGIALQSYPADRQVAALHTAMTSVILALGQVAPQICLLEDIHWFDPATLEALIALLPALRDARVLLVISGRADEMLHRSAVWECLLKFDRSGLFHRVDLHGLSEENCAELVRRALHMRQIVPRFSARLHHATNGNPFFILEILRALQDQGVLKRDEQGIWHTPWDAPGTDYSDIPLPTALQDAIDARLGGLKPDERAALAAASVLGQNFAPATWARIAGATTPPIELLRRQFLVEENDGYRFGHETLREAIYRDLDDPTRRALHLRAADALEQEHYARVEAMARHLYLAEAWEKALPYLTQAGDRAREVYAWQDALRCFDQALDAAAHLSTPTVDLMVLWGIQLRRGQTLTPLGDYPAAIAAYEDVVRLVEQDAQAPDAPARAGARRSARIQALNGLCYVCGQRNDYTRARAAIKQAMALAVESPRLIDRAEIFYQAGLISYRLNDYDEARRMLDEAMKLYEALGLDLERTKCLIEIGSSFLRQDGPTDQVIDYYMQALEGYRQQGDRFGEHFCLTEIANTYLMRGRLVEAVQSIEQCLSFFNAIGALDNASWGLFVRGEAYRRMGRQDESLQSLRESLAICKRLDRPAAADFILVSIAATLRDMGQPDQALELLEQPLRLDDRLVKTRALFVAATIWHARARIDRAWSCLEEALTLARWVGARAYLGMAYRLLAQLRLNDHQGRLPPPTADLPDCAASFAESIRLLQEAHCDDELALTLLANGQYLLANQRPADARSALIQAQMLMQRCGMIGALTQVSQLIGSLQSAPITLRPGQQRVLLAKRGAPRGRSLRPDELVEVIWTVDEPDRHADVPSLNKALARQDRLRRLCAEAAAQGAEPTIGDLATALGVTARTIDRDIAALRAAGEVFLTRGAV